MDQKICLYFALAINLLASLLVPMFLLALIFLIFIGSIVPFFSFLFSDIYKEKFIEKYDYAIILFCFPIAIGIYSSMTYPNTNERIYGWIAFGMIALLLIKMLFKLIKIYIKTKHPTIK